MNNEPEEEYNNMVLQPKNVSLPLFDHQRRSIYKMQELESQKDIIVDDNSTLRSILGINADPTGYGKTLSMVGLVALDKMKWEMDKYYERKYLYSEYNGIVSSCRITKYDRLPCTLVLVSQSIVAQWLVDFQKSDLRVTTVLTRKDIDKVDAENYDVIIVSLTMYNGLISRYSGYAWKRFIFDEPGHVRVVGMKPIAAGFTWLVTATPGAMTSMHCNCKNSYMKSLLRSITYCTFSDSYMAKYLTVRNSIEYVEKSFKMPVTHHSYYKCYQPLLDVISGMVNTNIQELVEAGNIEGAITALGGNKTKNIIELVTNKKLEELEEINAKINIYTIRQDTKRKDEWQSRKDKLNLEINEISSRFKTMSEDVCVVCYEVKTEPIMVNGCNHMFCGDCLLNWLKKNPNCPLCRKNVKANDLVYIKKDDSTIEEDSIMSKNDTILKLLNKNKEGKFVIFSNYDETFYSIFGVLNREEITHNLLKGTSKSREGILDRFREGDTRVLLLNSAVNAAGINLREATDIILYHAVNDSTMNQIIGRANRLGRNTDLRVHHLV